MGNQLNRPVLVLNASYEAISAVPAHRAMTLLCKGTAETLEVSQHIVRTGRLTLPVPSVIRLKYYRRIPRMQKSISRKAILLRDGYTCQYCGQQLESGELTMDHVIPKSRGGAFSWENIVTSCFSCNSNRKRDKTPEEAGMLLLSKPIPLYVHTKYRKMMSQADRKTWGKYIYA